MVQEFRKDSCYKVKVLANVQHVVGNGLPGGKGERGWESQP